MGFTGEASSRLMALGHLEPLPQGYRFRRTEPRSMKCGLPLSARTSQRPVDRCPPERSCAL